MTRLTREEFLKAAFAVVVVVVGENRINTYTCASVIHFATAASRIFHVQYARYTIPPCRVEIAFYSRQKTFFAHEKSVPIHKH